MNNLICFCIHLDFFPWVISIQYILYGFVAELKKLIEKFYAGDEEAIPSIFEAILKRKLAGNNDEADKELMEEIVGKNRELLDDIDDEESESDLDEVCDTDENIVELRNAKETLMKRKVRDE